MTVIDRLLTREAIDSLELELAAARGADPGRAGEIEAEIRRLEARLQRSAKARDNRSRSTQNTACAPTRPL